MAFGRFAGALTSLLYWAGTPMWLGGSVAVVAMSVYERFIGDLSQSGLYVFGAVFVGLATLGAVVPLRFGKWVPTSGAIGQIACSPSSPSSVVALRAPARHPRHRRRRALARRAGVFIAVVPVLLYSFVGVELPSTAAEEMRDPRRDIPVAIARAGIGQALMYGIPILAVLVVLPAERITSLHGLIDAMKTVFTVYGGEVVPTVGHLDRGRAVARLDRAAVFIWVLLASGSAWIMGAGRAQAAACLDGAGPRVLGRISARTGVPVVMGLVSGGVSLLRHGGRTLAHRRRRPEVLLGRPDGLHRLDRAGLSADLSRASSAAAGTPARAWSDRSSCPAVRPRPGSSRSWPPAGRCWYRLPAVARVRHVRSRRTPCLPGSKGPAPPVRVLVLAPLVAVVAVCAVYPSGQPAGLTVRSACRRPGRTGRPTVRGRTR